MCCRQMVGKYIFAAAFTKAYWAFHLLHPLHFGVENESYQSEVNIKPTEPLWENFTPLFSSDDPDSLRLGFCFS